jgi:hypothetical protein
MHVGAIAATGVARPDGIMGVGVTINAATSGADFNDPCGKRGVNSGVCQLRHAFRNQRGNQPDQPPFVRPEEKRKSPTSACQTGSRRPAPSFLETKNSVLWEGAVRLPPVLLKRQRPAVRRVAMALSITCVRAGLPHTSWSRPTSPASARCASPRCGHRSAPCARPRVSPPRAR